MSVLLDSHHDLVVGAEIDFLEPPDLGPHILEACELLDNRDERVLGPGTDTGDPFWYDGAHFVKQCERYGLTTLEVVKLVRVAMGDTGGDVSSFLDRCHLMDLIGEHRRRTSGSVRWGFKLQRKINRVDEFAKYWPKAHFVHIVRDGRDLAASHLKSVSWGFDEVKDAAKAWVDVVERPASVAPPNRYIEIRYEDLVDSPRQVLRDVADFLDLQWDDAMLRHWEHPHSLFDMPWGHPSAEASARPLSATSIGRFQMDLTSEEIADFERIAGDQLNRFGYATEMGSHSEAGW